MIEIVPTILVSNINEYNQFLNSYKAFSKRIQVDISDGQFAPSRTLSITDIPQNSESNKILDIHMMVKNPSAYVDTLISIRPSLVIFHAEVNENLIPVFQRLSEAKIKTGIAMLPSTFPGDIKPYIELCDHVLIFAGRLGEQGGNADLLQLEKIKIIRSIDDHIEIGWDGGANMDNIRTIAHSGVNVINVGRAISGSPNPQDAYKNLEIEADKQGVNI